MKLLNHLPTASNLTLRRSTTAQDTRLCVFSGDTLVLSVSLSDDDLAAMQADRRAIGTLIAPPGDEDDEPADADATPLHLDVPEPVAPDFGAVSDAPAFQPDLGDPGA